MQAPRKSFLSTASPPGDVASGEKARPSFPRFALIAVAAMTVLGMCGAFLMFGIGASVLLLLRSETGNPAAPSPSGPSSPGAFLTETSPNGSRLPEPAAASERVVNGWTVRDEPAAQFRAAFPEAPWAIDPLAQFEAQPGEEGALSEGQRALFNQCGMKLLGVEYNGRKYMIVATPISSSGTNAATWMNGAARSVRLANRGYEVESAATGAIGGHPYCDFTARFFADTKLVRLTRGNEFVYSLTIEGDSLSFTDPDAERFFGGFEHLNY